MNVKLKVKLFNDAAPEAAGSKKEERAGIGAVRDIVVDAVGRYKSRCESMSCACMQCAVQDTTRPSAKGCCTQLSLSVLMCRSRSNVLEPRGQVRA